MHRLARGIVLLLAVVVASPAAWALDHPAERLVLVGGRGGTPFTRSCPAGQVLTGVRARIGLAMDSIGIKCRPVLAGGTLGTEQAVGTLAGGPGGNFIQRSCPHGSVVNGFAISIAAITYVRLTCHAWAPVTRTWEAEAGNITLTTPGGSLNLIHTTARCLRQTQPARAIWGRAGSLVDALSLICDEP